MDSIKHGRRAIWDRDKWLLGVLLCREENWVHLEEDTASDMFVFSWCLKLEK